MENPRMQPIQTLAVAIVNGFNGENPDSPDAAPTNPATSPSRRKSASRNMFLFSTKHSKRKKIRTRNSPDLPATSMRRQARARKPAKKTRRRQRKNHASRHRCVVQTHSYKERRFRQFRHERRFILFAESRRIRKTLLRRVQRVLPAMFEVCRLMAGDQLNNTRPQP